MCTASLASKLSMRASLAPINRVVGDRVAPGAVVVPYRVPYRSSSSRSSSLCASSTVSALQNAWYPSGFCSVTWLSVRSVGGNTL